MDEAEFGYLWERRYQLLVRVRMNRLYYQQRRHIFETREGLTKVASIVAGSIAFGAVSGSPDVAKACAVIIGAASSASLVLGWGAKARDSASRQSDWAMLEHDIAKKGERHATDDDLNQWDARANAIEASEPATNGILLERCHVQAVAISGGEMDRKPTLLERFTPLPLLIIP